MQTHQLVIIADDLTGACDTALQFHTAGYRAAVAIEPITSGEHDADVLALNTDSRDDAPDVAFGKVVAALGGVQAQGSAIYKKIDSALRGNVGREIDAVLSAGAADLVLLTPAFPTLGRTVEGGVMFINGQPLAATPFVATLPHATSRVTELVAATGHTPHAHIDLATIRAGDVALERAVLEAQSAGCQVIVCDATTSDDLLALAHLLRMHPHWCGAGSAGLAGALAATLERSTHGKRSAERVTPLTHPILTVVGSIHPVARAQHATLHNDGSLLSVALDSASENRTAAMAGAVAQLGALLAEGKDCTLTTILPEPSNGPHSDATREAKAISETLGSVVAQLAPLLGGLVLTGGDTALSVLRGLGVDSVDVVGQVQHGVPALIVRGGVRPGLPVVTKAGSFGVTDTLIAAHRFLRTI